MCIGWRILNLGVVQGQCDGVLWILLRHLVFQSLSLIVCGQFCSSSVFLRVLWHGDVDEAEVFLRYAAGAALCIMSRRSISRDALNAIDPRAALVRP